MFKNTEQEGDDFKKKREQFTQSVRKTNRQQIFSKKRNILTNTNNNQNIQESSGKKDKHLIVDDRYKQQIAKFLKSTYTMQNFHELVQSITSDDVLRQHYGLIGIRKILSIAQNPPIQPVIDAGLVPRMIQYVKQSEYPQLQLQATWALTNVASGTTVQCQSIIDKGGIPLFVQLIKSQNLGIVEQAIWAIGNIASDCVFYRDTIIRSGGLLNLVDVIQKTNDDSILKHGSWALSNLCRGNPLPKYQNVKLAIPVLCDVVAKSKIQDKQILADCCWAISYHSDNKKNKVDILLQSGIIPRVVKFIDDDYLSIVVPSIRIAGNVSTGTAAQTDQLLKYDVLNSLQKVLPHHKKVVRRQACWVISNIAAGVRSQVQAILAKQNLLKQLFELFQTDANDVKRQICFIFSNMAHSGQPQIIFEFYKKVGIIRFYTNLLTSQDNKTVEVCLESLFIVLGVGQKFKSTQGKNLLVMELYNIGAIDQLQKLQYHDSDIVYGNVSKILQAYFQIQDPLQI